MPEFNEVAPFLQTVLATWGIKIAAGLAILLAGRMVAGLVRKGVRRTLTRAHFDPTQGPIHHRHVAYGLAAGRAGLGQGQRRTHPL